CIQNEDDARPSESCADRLYRLVYDENEQHLHSWWLTFWSIVSTKYPNIAVDHIPQFLDEIIDHKQLTLLAILSVSRNCRV
ncbi:unnamed protein product, partial [Rotaria sp. Silwood2]